MSIESGRHVAWGEEEVRAAMCLCASVRARVALVMDLGVMCIMRGSN